MHRPQLSTPAASVSLILLPDEFLKTVFLNECKIFQHTHVIPCPVSLIQCFQPFARIYDTSFAVYVKYKPYHYSKVKNMTRRCTNSGAAYHWRICQSNGRDRIQATWGVKPFRNGHPTDKPAFSQHTKRKTVKFYVLPFLVACRSKKDILGQPYLQKLFADLCHFVLIQQNWHIYQANKSYKTPVCLRVLKLLETDPPRTNLHFCKQAKRKERWNFSFQRSFCGKP